MKKITFTLALLFISLNSIFAQKIYEKVDEFTGDRTVYTSKLYLDMGISVEIISPEGAFNMMRIDISTRKVCTLDKGLNLIMKFDDGSMITFTAEGKGKCNTLPYSPSSIFNFTSNNYYEIDNLILGTHDFLKGFPDEEKIITSIRVYTGCGYLDYKIKPASSKKFKKLLTKLAKFNAAAKEQK